MLPFAAAVIVRISLARPDGTPFDTPILKGPQSRHHSWSIRTWFDGRSLILPRGLATTLRQHWRRISGRVFSFGLVKAVSENTLRVVGAEVSNLFIDTVPTMPQAYGEPLSGPPASGSEGRLLSVSLYDAFGNHNTSSNVPILLELSGQARFLDGGWLVNSVIRYRERGRRLSDAVLAPPPSFVELQSVVQAVAVDGYGPAPDRLGHES